MLTDNNQIFRNCSVGIYCHLTKVSFQINKCIIFEPNELSITLPTLWLKPLAKYHIQMKLKKYSWSGMSISVGLEAISVFGHPTVGGNNTVGGVAIAKIIVCHPRPL